MSRPVAPPSEATLRALAQDLISETNGRGPSLLDALSDLNGLGDLISASIPEESPPPVAESAPARVQTNAVPSPAPAAPRMQVSERHQGPATQDPSVLEALLRYHQSHAPARGARSAPLASAGPDTSPEIEAPELPVIESETPGFAPAEIPVIDAKPKPPSSFLRSTHTRSVLRT